jgi:photosystem II stability/assembly factor-like uncharacterized protein
MNEYLPGKYQTAVTVQDGAGIAGKVYVSSNSGQSWSAVKTVNSSLHSVAISNDGKIQTMVERSGFIYLSEDYGLTWTQKTNTPRGWNDVAFYSTSSYERTLTSCNLG